MVDQVKIFLGFALGVATMVMLAFILLEQEGRYYDCGMAEWHPDIPAEVKEECRRRRQEYIKGSKITI